MDTTEIIRKHYDANVEGEWRRIANRPEFLITCRFMNRYINPSDRVLDIGGGPGRYSMWLAEKGCDVTLFDLSPENVRFAKTEARNRKLSIRAIEGDARIADELVSGSFDHVLLMGPLYHLQEEDDRARAVNAALRLLKPGGVLFVSFIQLFAGIIFGMKRAPETILDPKEAEFFDSVLNDKSFGGLGFTQTYMISQKDVLPFMAQFPLEGMHLFGQEGILAPYEKNILAQPEEIYARWLDLAEKLCERDEFLSWSEHLMYVGRKL